MKAERALNRLLAEFWADSLTGVERKEEKLAEFWRAVDPYYVVAENLATSLSLAMWKVENVSNEQRAVIQEIARQNADSSPGFFTAFTIKCKR